MENQFENFIKVLESFDREGVEYILIGGVAMVLHGMERLTRDIDIFVKIEPENIEKLRKALYRVFQDDSIEEITSGDLDRYPVIRYGTPDNFYIDIMARIGEMFTFEDLEYEIVEYQGAKIKIATPDTLFKLKKDTICERDKIDALFLRDLIHFRKSNRSNKKQLFSKRNYMPVYKYKTFEEAERALWNYHPDEAYYKRVAELWAFANQLSSIAYPRGIFKYRSIEEANKQRAEWELTFARELVSKRKLTGQT